MQAVPGRKILLRTPTRMKVTLTLLKMYTMKKFKKYRVNSSSPTSLSFTRHERWEQLGVCSSKPSPSFWEHAHGFLQNREWNSWWYLLQKSILQKSSISGHFALLNNQRDLPDHFYKSSTQTECLCPSQIHMEKPNPQGDSIRSWGS